LWCGCRLQADKKVVLIAVAQNGRALDYAVPALKGDREVVMVAVGQNGTALMEASDELQSDKEVSSVVAKLPLYIDGQK